MPVVDLESPDAGSAVDDGVLIAFDWLFVFSWEDQELDVNLDLVTWNLLLVAGGVGLTEPCYPREPVLAIALEDTGYAGSGDLDVAVARQVPNDTHGSQMVGLAQAKNLLKDLRWCSVLWVLWDRILADQGSLTMLLERRLPAVETGSACAEVPAGPTDMPRFLGMLENLQFALNIAIF